MERFDFSTGHIFIKSDPAVTFWTLFLNGSGNCGRSESRSQAIKEILSHWKISDKLKSEIVNIFDNKKPAVSVNIGEQLELF